MDDIIGILFMLILIGALVFALRDTSKLATRQQQQPKRPPTNAFGEQALVGIALVGGVFVLLLPGWGVILTVWLFLVSVPGIGIQFIPPFRWPKEAKTMAGTLWNIAVWCFFTLFVAGIAFLLGGLLNGFIKSIGLVNPPDMFEFRVLALAFWLILMAVWRNRILKFEEHKIETAIGLEEYLQEQREKQRQSEPPLPFD